MANGDPQNNIAASVAASYDMPIAVSVIEKLAKFPFLQQLGYNGQLSWLQGGFLGLQDFFDEMTTYSSAADILQAAWQLIQKRVPLNLDVQKSLYTTDSMGTVGNAFQQLVGFQQTFAVNPDDLSDSTGSAVVASNLPSS
ncbi:MAG: hypothetical protein WCE63_10060 [Acidobacteriaceae bacterium]|jgi:hypothetical protein